MLNLTRFAKRQPRPERRVPTAQMVFPTQVCGRAQRSTRTEPQHSPPVPVQAGQEPPSPASTTSTPPVFIPLPATVAKVWQWDSSYGFPSPNALPNSPPASPIRAGQLHATTTRSCAGSPGSDSVAGSKASPSATSLTTSPRAALALEHGRPYVPRLDLSFLQEDCVVSERALATVTVACQQEVGRERAAEKVLGLMDSLWFDGLP